MDVCHRHPLDSNPYSLAPPFTMPEPSSATQPTRTLDGTIADRDESDGLFELVTPNVRTRE